MERAYKCPDVVMLVASGTVVENFTPNAEAFVTERPQWDLEYMKGYEIDINRVLKKYLGINSHNQVKNATAVVKELQDKATENLSMFKKQVEIDFKSDKNRLSLILDILGFAKSWKKASNHNQSAIVELLLTFSNKLTPELKLEIIGKGVNVVRIDAVLAHATTLHKANITQESLKGLAVTQTDEAITEFNKIYDVAINICEIGQGLFLKDKSRKEMFVWDKLVRTQIAAGVGGEKPTPPKKEAQSNA